MKVVPLEKPDVTLREVAELARSGTVILTRNGQPFASVKDLSDADWESVSLANDPRFRRLIEESRRSFRREGGIPLKEIAKELGLKVKKTPRPKKKRQA